MARETRTRSLILGVSLGLGACLATAAAAQFGGGYPYQDGKQVYEHICQGCHMPDAKGAVGAGMYPALAGNAKLKAPLYPVLVILRGQKAMPSFAELSNDQVAAVTNYIRTSYGNAGPGTVTVDQVRNLRAQAVKRDALSPG